MKITIDKKDYELNVEKAKELGVLNEYRELTPGDIYKTPNVTVILGYSHYDRKFYLFGATQNPFLGFGDRPLSAEDMKKYLNEIDFKFVKNVSLNINDI